MAKRRTVTGLASDDALITRILESIQQALTARESGPISQKEFESRIRSAMNLARGLPESVRRKLQGDAQSAMLAAKDSAVVKKNKPLGITSRDPRGPLTEPQAQQRLRVLLGPEPETVRGARISRKAPQPFVGKAFGGFQLPNVAEPRLAAAITSGDRPGVKSLVKGQQRVGGFKQLGAGGVGGALGLLILKSLFAGKQNDGIDPAVQFQLAQQLGGGGGQQPGVNTSRTLSQVGKLLSIMKSIQGIGGLAGPASQEPRLI